MVWDLGHSPGKDPGKKLVLNRALSYPAIRNRAMHFGRAPSSVAKPQLRVTLLRRDLIACH